MKTRKGPFSGQRRRTGEHGVYGCWHKNAMRGCENNEMHVRVRGSVAERGMTRKERNAQMRAFKKVQPVVERPHSYGIEEKFRRTSDDVPPHESQCQARHPLTILPSRFS